jgi:2-keto-3-deoxy-L-rhamnonate aldolase RhmA
MTAPRQIRIGCWLDLPSPEVAEIVAGAGFDFALVDLEHGAIGIETAQRMLMALAASGTEPVMRVPEASEAWMKRALDMGAAAVMVPRVEDAATAARLAAFATYGPEGRRGEGLAIARASGWGRAALPYRTQWREKGGLILQIESPEGVAAAPAIAATPGVTELFFGPSDYAGSIGAAPDDPRIGEAARAVAAAARGAGRAAGSFVFAGAGFDRLAAMGFSRAAAASDIVLLVEALDAHLVAARREAGGEG